MSKFTSEHVERLAAILVRAATEEIMPRFGKVTMAETRRKSSAFDIVTAADEAAEALIESALRADFPGCVVIGEETADRDPALLDRLASAELSFLIDPLDGTRNFASGLPLFGLMGAAVIRGEVVAGVIHDPVCGTVALASAGAGAWLQDRSGERTKMRVAAPVPPRDMEAIAGTTFLPEPLRSRVSVKLSRLQVTNWFRCAAHEYVLAARGHCHILFYNRLMPWDHAAGWLLHREAGGYSAHFDGSSYRPTHRSGGLLCAPDHTSWEAVREALLD